MTTALTIQKELTSLANKSRAKAAQGYFKTGKGEYGEGDIFIGISVPVQRSVAEKYTDIPLTEITKLLASKIHEHRFTALEILDLQFQKASLLEQKRIVAFYLKHKKHINNWDLVDTSAHQILGNWLLDKDRSILYTLAGSKSLWDKRISIISTFAFIRNNDFKDTIRIAEILLPDNHDLIHKAVGWMLREMGKRSEKTLVTFLTKHKQNMPRTMLRYAIEKFPPEIRKSYLAK